MPRTYFFIINPNSGTRRAQAALPEMAQELYPASTELHYTAARGDARRLAAEAAARGFDVVVAAGGDGTINEAVQALAHTDTALGIIALGSGNGLARSLGVPLLAHAAMRKLLKLEISAIDLGRANGEYFANVAGVGVDAQLGRAFNSSGETGRRGMLRYFELGVREFLAYQPEEFEVSCEGYSFPFRPFTITAANGREYGSGAKIAHNADLADGLLELVCIPHTSVLRVPVAVARMFAGKLDGLEGIMLKSVKAVTLKRAGVIRYHLDGESRECQDSLALAIDPRALRILR